MSTRSSYGRIRRISSDRGGSSSRSSPLKFPGAHKIGQKKKMRGTGGGRGRPSTKKFLGKLTKSNDDELSDLSLQSNKDESMGSDTEADEYEADAHLGSPVDKESMGKLMRAYWSVRNSYESMVKTEGLDSFKRSRLRQAQANQSQSLNKSFSQLVLTPSFVGEKDDRKTTCLHAENGQVVQKCLEIPLEAIQPTPPMQYWTLTETNVIAEDEYTLSHIPFLGDTEDDTEFCEDLKKTFPEGIHGTKEGCGEYINDYILYYTVKKLKKKLREEPSTSGSLQLLPDELEQLQMKKIFRCIYENFPNKASIHQLMSMYPDLQLRFEPHKITRPEFTNAQGELVANFGSSRLLNSFDVLFCYKCLSYDCTMHQATIADEYSGTRREKRPSVARATTKENGVGDSGTPKACSAQCFMTICADDIREAIRNASKQPRNSLTVEGGPSGTGGAKNLGKQLNVEVGTSERKSRLMWTPHEESIFNVLRDVFDDDYCKITKSLNICTQNKKTCKEVFEYSCRIAPLSPRLELHISPVKKCGGQKSKDKHRMFRAIKWTNSKGSVVNKGMFKPCKHKGECSGNDSCRCHSRMTLCTKYCACTDCNNRFPGCRCAPGNCRTKQCQCYYANWECDPDVCKSCNCDKFDVDGELICKNISIQRGLQKQLIVAPSQVAGWGCYANENIEKNDFISEYCGELISQAESERRGKIYDKIRCSYLFGLNDEQVVDATRIGNVIRFANHSKENANCRARVIVVNGEHKIGIFADTAIKAGEELFFDYAYNKSQEVSFVPKELSHVQKAAQKSKGPTIAIPHFPNYPQI